VRTLLAALAVLAFATGSVRANTITINGNISDWPANQIRTNNIATIRGGGVGAGTLDIRSYGAFKDSTTFYGFVQTWDPVGTDAHGWAADGYRAYPSAFINVDNDVLTSMGDIYQSGNPLPLGCDVDIEYDMDTYTPGLNFWGPPNNDNGASWIPVSGGHAAHSADGRVFEFSAPITSILASVAEPSGDGAIAASHWTVTMGGEAAPSYGRELGGPFMTETFVPEPGTLVLLITAGLSLVCYAWRRRRTA
jgi:hypothetical protein